MIQQQNILTFQEGTANIIYYDTETTDMRLELEGIDYHNEHLTPVSTVNDQYESHGNGGKML